MTYAVVRSGGKQYRVREGLWLKVEKLPGEPGSTVELNDVQWLPMARTCGLGAPTVPGRGW
ncbi:MAG: bL21 family ribosomal protein [Dehalococcoidia bacterium]